MTERWHPNVTPYGARVENQAVDAFLAEIAGVCEKHQMSISHQDKGGAFIITPHNSRDAQWLSFAESEIDPSTQPRNTP